MVDNIQEKKDMMEKIGQHAVMHKVKKEIEDRLPEGDTIQSSSNEDLQKALNELRESVEADINE